MYYKITFGNWQSENMEHDARDWADLTDYVFGNIGIIPTDKDGKEIE